MGSEFRYTYIPINLERQTVIFPIHTPNSIIKFFFRESTKPLGFQHVLTFDRDVELAEKILINSLDQPWKVQEGKNKKDGSKTAHQREVANIEPLGKGSAMLLPQDTEHENAWKESSAEESEDEIEIIEPAKCETQKKNDVVEISDGSGSEEDDVVIINEERGTTKKKK